MLSGFAVANNVVLWMLAGLIPNALCSSSERAASWRPFASLLQVSHPGTVSASLPGLKSDVDNELKFQAIGKSGVAETCLFLSLLLRWTYQEFFSRYRVLMKQKDVLPDKKLTCRNVLEKLVRVSQAPSVSTFPGFLSASDPCLWFSGSG